MPNTAKRSPPTMDDIARLSGVNKSTVSRALAGNPAVAPETREKIEQIVRELGYVVNQAARGLRMQRSMMIAVLVPLQHDRRQALSDPFFTEMLAHLADQVSNHGYDLILSKVASHSADWIMRFQQARRADGLILIGQSFASAEIADAARAGIPLVVWGARMARQGYVTVGSDNVAGAALATRHLLAAGRRRVAFLGDIRLPEIAQRHAGYLQAHAEAGIKPDPQLTQPTGFAADEAREAAERLLRRPRQFDGLVTASDVVAMSCLQVLAAKGLAVPDDVAVVGYDDISLASHTSPPLTTVHQDIGIGAELLVKALMARIEGRQVKSTQIAPRLVVRGSTP